MTAHIGKKGKNMICLRCGYCCLTSLVVIVDDPDLGPVEGNLKGLDGTERCPHLRGDEPGKYSCAIHSYPWYKETPCFEYRQIEGNLDTPCRIGMSKLGYKEKTREEIEKLKQDWMLDPFWDIEDTEGFELYRNEL
ncbi:MAG: hypothetical protein ACFFBS_10400, partial [Promethearchaeota archaeon]